MTETPPPPQKARYVPPRVVVLSTRDTTGTAGAGLDATEMAATVGAS